MKQKTGISADKITRKKLQELRDGWAYKVRKKDDMDAPVDLYLYNLARRQGKWTGGIEDVADQIDLDDELGKTLDIEELVEDIDVSEKVKTDYLDRMIGVYTSEDISKLDRTVAGKYEVLKRDIVLIRRNIKMAFRIDSLAHVRNTFFAVGAAHLPGDSGLIELLQGRGFTVEPVFSTAKIVPEKYTYTAVETPWVKYTDADSAYTADLPGKPGEMAVPGNEMKLKVYFDHATGLAYITGYSYLLDGENAETISKRMKSFFAGEKGQLLEEKKVSHNGIDGDEITCSRDGYFYRIQNFVAGKKVFVALTGSEKKELLISRDAEKFLKSFTANTAVEKKEKPWQHFLDTDKAFEADFPGKPTVGKLADTESPGFETTTYTSIDKLSSNYFLVVVSKVNKAHYIEDDSSVFYSKLEYYKQLKAGISDLRHFRFQGYPAITFTACLKSNGLDFAAKLLVVCRGNISYTTAAIVQKGKEDFVDVTNFFRSFKFTPEKATNWQQYENNSGGFSIWSPSKPEILKTDTVGLSETGAGLKLERESKMHSYFTYDPANANSWYVYLDTADKYYWATDDSSFITDRIKTMYTDTANYYAKNHPGNFD